jgi:8-oxo-dGTP pyrophosphatase MutT (NUDIX family)
MDFSIKKNYSEKSTHGEWTNKMINIVCNNCGKYGHMFYQCKMPITSIGIIVFRKHEGQIQYLMIRRKDTLGFIEFIRGKYSIYNKEYIMNLLNEMTVEEKLQLRTQPFSILWENIWSISDTKKNNIQYKNEESISYDKYNALKSGIILQNDDSASVQSNKVLIYTLDSLLGESKNNWLEPEWGFPKGKRNTNENDYECALREFCEETGYDKKYLKLIDNIAPFEEVFMGSNYKSYKHKYFLMFMEEHIEINNLYDNFEVSKIEWKTYDECISCIRDYNLEKKRVIRNINNTLLEYSVI